MPWWLSQSSQNALKKENAELKAKLEATQKALVDCWSKNLPHPQPERIVDIHTNDIHSLGLPSQHKADTYYRLVSKADFDRWIKKDTTSERKYIKDLYDCDDFAHDLVTYAHEWVPGLCIGEVWIKSRPHAINIFVDIDKKVWMYEPQNDNFWECDMDDIYFMRL